MLPKTKAGFRYLLVCVDLATDEIDFEPMKTKTPTETLKAFKQIFKRDTLDIPHISMGTDAGGEFLGVVAEYFYEKSILHRKGKSARHRQQANVEKANQQIGFILNSHMNSVQYKTKKPYYEWTTIIPDLRIMLNDARRLSDKAFLNNQNRIHTTTYEEPQYEIGDLVHVRLDKPQDALGNTHASEKFRTGDTRYDFQSRKITNVLLYPENVRYMVSGIRNVSYTEAELIEADEQEEEMMLFLKKIIDKGMIDDELHYKVWWDKELKKNATWESAEQLKKDGLQEHIDFFENSIKKMKKKK